MFKLSLLTVALLAAAPNALAQPPVGGGQLQQIPPAPAPSKAIPELRIERGQPPATAEPAGVRILVKTLHISGQTRFSEAQLIAAADFHPDAELDLAGLRAMAARITAFYGRHGYFVAQAYLPAQDIADGAVTIAVIEGRYGKVAVNNQSRVKDRLARSIIAGLNPGDPVATRPLERRLLLLSDLPGVTVASTLTPGADVGTSDLQVELNPGRRVTGSLQADNGGSRYTGEYRAGAAVNFNEPLGLGDVASLRVLTAGEGLNYARLGYQAQVQDATVGVAYARLQYRLGKEFSGLHAHGTADIASVYGSYPLIRSHDTNLYAQAGLEAKRFEDDVDAAGAKTQKTARVGNIGLTGDHRDSFGGGGWSSYWATLSLGDLNIKTPLVRATDAATARTQGSYSRLSFEVDRVQAVRGPLSLYGQLRGQVASKNLDTSEKMELGGAYGVRAYPEGEAYGDDGYIATLEARLAMPALSERLHGQLQAAAFVDNGSVTVNHDPWSAGPNHRTLSAAGLGLTWAGEHGLVAKVSYAIELGNERATAAPDHTGRLWVQLTKFF